MDIDPQILIIGGVSLLAGLLILVLASSFRSKEQRTFDNRLRRVKGEVRGRAAKGGGGDGQPSLRRNERDSGIAFLDTLIKKYLPKPALLRARLEQTGFKISLGEYFLFSVFIALAFGFVGAFLLGRLPVIAALAGLAAGIGLPHFLVNTLIARRLKAFTAEFPEGIDLIVRGLKSGLPVPASMRTVAEEIKDPVGYEFALISDRVRVGETLEDSLIYTADRIPTPEFRFFVTSLSVQRETGGNLAETLENLSDVLRKRRQMKLKIKAMSSEAKASALILGSLPFLMFGIMMLLNPTYVLQLFTDPRGLIMVAVGLGSLGLGIVVMAKMVRFEI